MKKVFLTLCIATMGIISANAQNQQMNPAATRVQNQQQQPVAPPPVVQPTPTPAAAPDPDAGIFKFKEETHDYGDVPEGPLAECDFTFKNVGKKPIVITEAHGSCGCTVPKWPSEPIAPGKTGTIHVAYTTQGRQGMISKDVTINSNAQQQPMVLHIKGTVKPKPVDSNATPASGTTTTPAPTH